MNAIKIIAYIAAVIFIIVAAFLIFIGFSYIAGAFSPEGSPGWITNGIVLVVIGLIFAAIGLGLIWFGSRQKTKVEESVTLQIDLPADVNLDTLKCQHCGGAITTENIKMVAGAPVVDCPYCNTTYQITEEPKW